MVSYINNVRITRMVVVVLIGKRRKVVRMIPDNYSCFEQHEAEQDRWLKMLPKCRECKEHIQDEYCYKINGEYICESCMEEHRVSVDTLID